MHKAGNTIRDGPSPSAGAIIRSLADQTRMITFAFRGVGSTALPLYSFLSLSLSPCTLLFLSFWTRYRGQPIERAPRPSLLAFNNISRIIESHYGVRCDALLRRSR